MEKKKTYEKQLAEYEKQKDSELEEMRDVAQAEKEGIKHKFEQTEKSIVTKRKDQPKVRNLNPASSHDSKDKQPWIFSLPNCK